MKKVIERVQRENESLKKSSTPANQTRVVALQQENLRLKVRHHFWHSIEDIYLDSFPYSLVQHLSNRFCFNLQNDNENLKSQSQAELNSQLESKNKQLEKVVMENERLRRNIKRVTVQSFTPLLWFVGFVWRTCVSSRLFYLEGSGICTEVEGQQDESGGD